MFTPKAVVVEDNETFKKEIISKLEEIGFSTISYASSPENLDGFKNSHIGLFDIHLGEGKETGLSLAGRVKEEYPNVPLVVMTEHSDKIEYLQEFARTGFDGWIDKSGLNSSLIKKIDELAERGRFKVPLQLALIGGGNIGIRTLEWVLDSENIGSIFFYSAHNYELDKYQSLKDSFEFVDYGGDSNKKLFLNKVSLCDSLEELLSNNPDIITLTSGARYVKGKEREQEFKEAAPKVYSILKAIKELDYNGSLIMAPNPLETFMEIAREMGFSTQKMIGISPDAIRARKLARAYEEATEPVSVLTTGTHSNVIPLLSSALVGKRKLGSYQLYRNPFTKMLRRMGKDSMDAKEQIGSNIGVSSALKELTRDISTMQCRITSCFSIWDPNEGYFREMPIEVKYPSLEFLPGELPEMDEWETAQFIGDKERYCLKQKEVAAEFLESVGYTKYF